jgi:hypothetical protein
LPVEPSNQYLSLPIKGKSVPLNKFVFASFDFAEVKLFPQKFLLCGGFAVQSILGNVDEITKIREKGFEGEGFGSCTKKTYNCTLKIFCDKLNKR